MHDPFEAAIFDFGGVLTTPIRASFELYEQEAGLPEGSLLKAFLHAEDGEEPHYHALERGEIPERDFFTRMIEQIEAMTGIAFEQSEDPSEFRRRMFARLEPNTAMLDAARRIGGRYRTAILSNNVREWTEWRAMVAPGAFHLIIDSCEVGTRKPEPEIYHLTCRRLGVEPSKAVFVDDIPWNVEAAEKIGLTAIRFTETEEVLAALATYFPRAFEPEGAVDA